ncbi:MAG: hypothetical protein ABFC89_02690 [Methanospirillum sp.]
MREYDPTFLGGVVLLGGAAVLFAVAALTGRGDMTSATLVLVGFGSFVGGVVLLTQYRGEQVAPWVAGLAAAGGVIDLARVAADLGLQGNAHLVPRKDGVVQVVPAGTVLPALPDGDYSFIDEAHGGGLLLVPTGRPLYDRLVETNGLVVPDTVEGVCTAIREAGGVALAVADRVEAVPEGEGLVVSLEGYRLYDGCRAVREVSPRVCTMIACPVCSCFGVMAAAGLGRTCVIENVVADDRSRSVRLVLRLLP